MKKGLILALAVSLIVAGIAIAGVVSTKHDMRSTISWGIRAASSNTAQVCVFCHHPHRGTSTMSTALLWNISDANTTYATYGPTSTTNATGMGSNLTTTGAGVYSLLCMGCHDGGGASSNNSFIRGTVDGTLGSFPNLGSGLGNLISSTTTLEDDHPVDFTYPTASAAGLEDIRLDVGGRVVSATRTYPLYSSTMQCATCHDVHSGQSPKVQFMRGGTEDIITNSLICVDCHMSK